MAFGDAVGATGPVLQGKGGGADFEVAEAEVFKDAELFLEGELALLLAPFGFGHGVIFAPVVWIRLFHFEAR